MSFEFFCGSNRHPFYHSFRFFSSVLSKGGRLSLCHGPNSSVWRAAADRDPFLNNREDARVSSTSPPYCFCRARHRRIFETLELYMDRYPEFWDWTWHIYRMAKSQVTDAAVAEPLVCGLKRAVIQGKLPDSPPNGFFQQWYDMIEGGPEPLSQSQPLGVTDNLAETVRSIHSLYHGELLDDAKPAGWGRDFDVRSDRLLGEAGEMLASRNGITDDAYKFAVAYGRLSMGLPYIAYHTVDAIIMAFGCIPPVWS